MEKSPQVSPRQKGLETLEHLRHIASHLNLRCVMLCSNPQVDSG